MDLKLQYYQNFLLVGLGIFRWRDLKFQIQFF